MNKLKEWFIMKMLSWTVKYEYLPRLRDDEMAVITLDCDSAQLERFQKQWTIAEQSSAAKYLFTNGPIEIKRSKKSKVKLSNKKKQKNKG